MVTPAQRSDLQRLRILRASCRQHGVTWPHAVVVEAAELAEFRDALAVDRNVVLITSSEVVPGVDELYRRLPQPLRPRLRAGWWRQQFVKLQMGEYLGSSNWVCVDSDNFFLRPPVPADFFTAGRLHLVERICAPVGPHVRRFNARSARLLKIPQAAVRALTYTGQVVSMSRSHVQEMQIWIESHYRLPWWVTMVSRGATEYSTYGQFVRFVSHRPEDVHLVDRYPSVDLYVQLPVDVARAAFARAQAAGKLVGMIHSHLGYRPDELVRITGVPFGGEPR